MSNGRKLHVFTEIPNYTGSAVYAFVDTAGRKYIGSTNNFVRRINQWETHIRKVLAEGKENGFVPHPLGSALLAGETFKVEIVERLPEKMTMHERVERERVAFEECGGVANTYNSMKPVCGKNNHRKGYTPEHGKAVQKHPQENKKQVTVWVRKDERDALKEEAEKNGQSMTQYIIQAVNARAGIKLITPARNSL